MVDIIIYIIVAIILFLALKGSIGFFTGKKTCCSGGKNYVKTAEKKLDGPVLGTLKVKVSGMHCDACTEHVKRAIDAIDGASAEVDLKSGIATVKYDRTLDEGKIRSQVESAGYKVESIS